MSKSTLGSEVLATLGASLVLGAVSTFGDWLWTHYIPDGAVIPGIAHGVIIFLVIAFVLAVTVRRGGGGSDADRAAVRRLIWALPVAGAVIAASFYPIYFVLGFLDSSLARYLGALLITWVAMWLVIAWLYAGASGGHEDTQRTLIRGALAAVGSGLAFWAISGIWTKAQPGGPNYLWHFACWCFAFLPGFAALLFLRSGVSGVGSPEAG